MPEISFYLVDARVLTGSKEFSYNVFCISFTLLAIYHLKIVQISLKSFVSSLVRVIRSRNYG